MSTPQDARARHRQKARRARKNAAWIAARTAENAEAAKPKASAKKTTA
jgi:hypothetical protein